MALLIYLSTAFLSNELYILKAAGIVIFNVILWSDDIKKALWKRRKKRNHHDLNKSDFS